MFSDPVLPAVSINLLDGRREGLAVYKLQASPLPTQHYNLLNITSNLDLSLASTYGYPKQVKLNRDTIEVRKAWVLIQSKTEAIALSKIKPQSEKEWENCPNFDQLYICYHWTKFRKNMPHFQISHDCPIWGWQICSTLLQTFLLEELPTKTPGSLPLSKQDIMGSLNTIA